MTTPFIYSPDKLIITVLIAFLPSIIYSIIIRYSEKYEREPWGSIGQAFIWGGTLSIVLVIAIRGYFRLDFLPAYIDSSDEQNLRFIVICILTPIIAEIIKPIGLLFVRSDILEAEDGLIYGAVIGCGYTATENLMFGVYLAPLYGINIFVTIVFVRTMSVMFIQSSTTALTCYGVTRAMKVKHRTGRFFAFPIFLFAAIAIHAVFNYFVYMDMFNIGEINIIFSISTSVLFSIIFALLLMFIIYFKIHRLDVADDKKDKEMAQKRSELEAGEGIRPRKIPQSNIRPQRRIVSRPQPRRYEDNYYNYPESGASIPIDRTRPPDSYYTATRPNRPVRPTRPPGFRPGPGGTLQKIPEPNYDDNYYEPPRPPKTKTKPETEVKVKEKKAKSSKMSKKSKENITIIRPSVPGQLPEEGKSRKGPRPIIITPSKDQDITSDSDEVNEHDDLTEGEEEREDVKDDKKNKNEIEIDWEE